jgi:predicted ABC-type sugar transport system permease subunit
LLASCGQVPGIINDYSISPDHLRTLGMYGVARAAFIGWREQQPHHRKWSIDPSETEHRTIYDCGPDRIFIVVMHYLLSAVSQHAHAIGGNVQGHRAN